MVRVHTRYGSRILPRGWGQFQRLNDADMAKESELLVARVQGLLEGPGSFQVFSAQICIIPHSRDSFPLISDI